MKYLKYLKEGSSTIRYWLDYIYKLAVSKITQSTEGGYLFS